MNDPTPDDLRDRLAALPREIEPTRDLWPGVRAQVARPPARASFARGAVGLALAAAVALAALVFWPRPADRAPGASWSVAAMAGAPRVGREHITTSGQWRAGQWLETDGNSRAKLGVGQIGELEIEPNSRLRLVSTAADNHRVELARGSMSAFIWAPPRLFFVETPSATAIDLGCAYRLSVEDDGTGILHVTAGYVALEHGARESIIPAGLVCLTRPGAGPGTPFAFDAPAAFRDGLARFDFGGDAAALGQILAAAREGDEVTLWHLLARAPAARRGDVFDRLAAMSPPPPDVTRNGIIAGDAEMRASWALALGLVPTGAKTRAGRGD